jgi:beta-phosphoglucomutase
MNQEPPILLHEQPRAVIWDVDGTLIDSGDLHFTAWAAILAERQFELTREQFGATFGQRNDAVLRSFLGAEPSDQELERIAATKEEHYRELLRTRGMQPLPGVRRWLPALKAGGWRQAIASSAPHANLEAILDALDLRQYFDAVVSGDDVPLGKPDPAIFRRAAELLQVEPRRCVVVEDAPVGVEGARRAGMHSVGVLFAHAVLDADVVVASLADLAENAFDRLVPASV